MIFPSPYQKFSDVIYIKEAAFLCWFQEAEEDPQPAVSQTVTRESAANSAIGNREAAEKEQFGREESARKKARVD